MIIIRRAVSGDVPALVPLLTQLFAQEAEFTPNPALQAKGLDAIIDGKGVGTVLIAERAGTAVGMVNLLYTVSTALGARVAILEDMIVDADARRGGIGSKLVAQAVETARADGCQRITVLSDGDNASAHRFYKRFGFERSGMVPFRLALKQSLTA